MFPPVTFRLEIVAECASTNEELLERRGPEFHGAVLLALRQSAGRGRRGRSWWSSDGNLTLSAGFRLAASAAVAPLLPFTAGLALHETLGSYLPSGADLRLKWPNDVYLGGRKLGGMLSQARQQGDGLDLVLGIGVNLKTAPPPESARVPAVSLAEFAPAPTPERITRELLRVWERLLVGLRDFPSLKERWEAAALLPGSEFRVVGEEGTYRALGILPTGELEARDEAGGQRVFASEEVSLALSET